jgi:putative membrane protein
MSSGVWSVGAGGGLFLGLVTLLLLVVLVAGAVYLLSTARRDADADTDALTVLRRRYARGEIDDEEFERRQTRLDGRAS